MWLGAVGASTRSMWPTATPWTRPTGARAATSASWTRRRKWAPVAMQPLRSPLTRSHTEGVGGVQADHRPAGRVARPQPLRRRRRVVALTFAERRLSRLLHRPFGALQDVF